MTRLHRTPSQTVGPYFNMRLAAPGENLLVDSDEAARIHLVGRVYDGEGKFVEDALLELWQANREGRYAHPADDASSRAGTPRFAGFGRVAVDLATGDYTFTTVKPGRVRAPDGGFQAPHLSLVVQARGMLNPCFTRVYFADEAENNERDFVLSRVPAERRVTLIADREPGASVPTYRFDVHLQGPRETVFFAI